MAFTLSFSVTERNDNKLLTITDTSGEVSTGTATGWGGGNPAYTAIVASGGLHTLELEIVYTAPDGTATTYDRIDLFTEFAPGGGFADIGDLVFPLDMSMLKVLTVAIGTSDDEFPDGLYEFSYVYDRTLAAEEETVSTETIYGQIRNSIYELSRTIPTKYECGGPHEKQTLDIIFMNTYMYSMLYTAAAGRETSVLNEMSVLQSLIYNYSTYTW